ncbi:hypothetical protein GCM10007160_14800 [Litchfieldella qijiaojingensis]|uniref:DUF1850 domain-containing protein n=1 Tax=Litchfieldella qijiaojingensis TaxID=980347 RepID=A0ABQ2YP58_9GAMM|nr:DUF1850 domain-containing protein [Halomonas qijiaojingensis]GGX88370.1 hypothetical protein GCM10007160_14800 [Halomonas qijiaojingensis]
MSLVNPWTGRALLLALSSFLAMGPFSGAAVSADAMASQPSHGAEQTRLEVYTADHRRIVSLPMPTGQSWCLVWNHSVEGFPVHDCYRNRDGRMVLERSHQPDYAAGLGPVLGRGEARSDGAGGYWIEDIDEPVSDNRYLLRVGSPAVNHRLESGDTLISLSELAAGERVQISLRIEQESSQ